MDCNCENKILDSENYFYYCQECGKIFDICPTLILNPENLFKQEGRSVRPSKFNPSKHFRNWIYLILGRSPYIPQSIIKKCRDDLPDSNIKQQIFSIRKSLKEIRKTELNKFTSAIWSMATGKNLPTVDGNLLYKSEMIFLNVLKNIKHKKTYYPYFIYKIWDLILPQEDREILDFIYLKSNFVIKKNDATWKKICEQTKLEFRETAAY